MNNFIGVDPGLDGAIAYLTNKGKLKVWDMPTFEVTPGKLSAKTGKRGKGRREVDVNTLSDILEDLHGAAFLEKVHSMPHQGVASMFSFGDSYGVVRGILAAYQIPITRVPPNRWKAELRCRQGKDASRLRASELMPDYSSLWQRVKDDGRAEAALIAYYGMKQEGR